MRIIEASAEQQESVIALWKSVGLTRPWNDPNADFERAISSPQSTVLVAFDEEAVVGSVMAGDDGHRGWLYYLSVDSNFRRQGIGRALVKAAEVWMRDRKLPSVRLMVRVENTEVLPFYDSLQYANLATLVLGRSLG